MRPKTILRGEASPHWKGDAATARSSRKRTRKQYRLGPCNRCGQTGVDRHHRDRNPHNNAAENIEILCRHCHRAEHGPEQRTPLSPCLNCREPSKPLRKGRCNACRLYLRRKGVERPVEEMTSV